MVYNRITVAFGALRKVTAPAISYQYDVTQVLVISGLNLPEYYVVDFCNEGDANVVPITGTEEGVEIPDSLLQTGKPIKAYIVVSSGQGDVQTRYEIKIPVDDRPLREDIDPTSDQQLEIDSLLAALNDGVSKAEEASAHAPRIVEGYWYIWDAEASEYVNTGTKAEAVDGVSPTVTVTDITGGHIIRIVDATGAHIFEVPNGVDGTDGVSPSITVESIEGGHRVTVTDATQTQFFDVTDGKNGKDGKDGKDGTDGDDGYSPAVTITSIEGGHRVNITDKDHPDGQNFDVMDGTSPENPVTSVNQKTGDVVLDSGDIGYDSTEVYSDGSVGKEIATLNSALTSLESVTEIIDTASGAIASFPDGSGLPIRSLVAEINPVQDLHGYDNPWPAGGGKNLFDVDSLISGGITGQGGDAANSGWRRTPYMYLKAGTYTISRSTADWWKMFKYSEQSTSSIIGQVFNNNTRLTETFTLDSGCYCRFGFDYIPTTADAIQLEAGSTATAWSPYSNLCPITGHTGLSVEVTGMNVWDEETQDGYYNADTGVYISVSGQLCSKNFTPVKPNTQYLFCKSVTRGDVLFYNSSKELIGSSINRPANSTFTTPDNCYFIKLNLGSSYGGTYNYDISINYPSTDTSYHAYTGEAISVSFGQTVYGGTDEVVSGNGTSTMVTTTLSSFNWSVGFGGFYCASFASVAKRFTYSEIPTFLCDRLKTVAYVDAKTSDGRISQVYGGESYPYNGYLFVYDTSCTTVDEFLAKYGQAQFVYELATPTTFTHEGQAVSTVVGQNNIFVDTGSVEVEYPADTKLYIDKKIAELAQ